jgi:hypothetical protein
MNAKTESERKLAALIIGNMLVLTLQSRLTSPEIEKFKFLVDYIIRCFNTKRRVENSNDCIYYSEFGKSLCTYKRC